MYFTFMSIRSGELHVAPNGILTLKVKKKKKKKIAVTKVYTVATAIASLVPRPSLLFACNFKKLGERTWGQGYAIASYPDLPMLLNVPHER